MPARPRPLPYVRPSRLRSSAFDGRGRCDVLPSCPCDRRCRSGPLGLDLGLEAQTIVTPLFPGITHIKRTEQYPPFQCPGCPAPTPNPRLARMNILLVDLTSPEVHFKLTPPAENLPAVAPGSTTTELARRAVRSRPTANPRLPQHLARAGGDQRPLLRAVPGAGRVDPERFRLRDRPRPPRAGSSTRASRRPSRATRS